MTEADWLTCDDPGRMLAWLRGGALTRPPPDIRTRVSPPSDRKLRLFACAWYRLILPHAGEHEARALAVEAGREDTSSFLSEVRRASHPTERPAAAALLRCIAGNPWRPVRLVESAREAVRAGPGWVDGRAILRPGGVPARVARAIYEGRRFGDLPVLADALEEAGFPGDESCRACWGGEVAHQPRGPAGQMIVGRRCRACGGTGRSPHPLLEHLRGPGPHARGCWVLDIILGKG